MLPPIWGRRWGFLQLEKCINSNARTVFLHVICLPQICQELPREVDSIGIVLNNTSISNYSGNGFF